MQDARSRCGLAQFRGHAGVNSTHVVAEAFTGRKSHATKHLDESSRAADKPLAQPSNNPHIISGEPSMDAQARGSPLPRSGQWSVSTRSIGEVLTTDIRSDRLRLLVF